MPNFIFTLLCIPQHLHDLCNILRDVEARLEDVEDTRGGTIPNIISERLKAVSRRLADLDILTGKLDVQAMRDRSKIKEIESRLSDVENREQKTTCNIHESQTKPTTEEVSHD